MKNKYISDIGFSESAKRHQEIMGSRETYQKMAEKRDWKSTITEDLSSFIKQRDSFYMASVNTDGQPYIQHRGGPKGFLKVIDEKYVAFADYSGNRQYISVGNFDDNNKVHLFLMDYANRIRIKIWGEVSVIQDDQDLLNQVGDEGYVVNIERIIKIKITAWDANCPQHIEPRYTIKDINPRLESLRNKIKELEEQLKNK